MLSKNTNARIIAVSEDKAKSLGIYNKDLRGVLIDGIPVEVNIVNENSARWNLPNIIVKADAYTQLKERGRGYEKFVNVYSNRDQNFQRWSKRHIVHEWATEKTDAVLSGFDYGYKESVNQIFFQEAFKDNRTWTSEELDNIREEVQKNELLTTKVDTLSRSQAIDARTEIISNYQVLLILLYNGYLSIKDKTGDKNKEILEKIKTLTNRIKTNLAHLGYDIDGTEAETSDEPASQPVAPKPAPSADATYEQEFDTNVTLVPNFQPAPEKVAPVSETPVAPVQPTEQSTSEKEPTSLAAQPAYTVEANNPTKEPEFFAPFNEKETTADHPATPDSSSFAKPNTTDGTFRFDAIPLSRDLQEKTFFTFDQNEIADKGLTKAIQHVERNYYRYSNDGIIGWVDEQKKFLDSKKGVK